MFPPPPRVSADVHGLREAHDLHLWRPNLNVQREYGGQPDVGAAVQWAVCLPLSGRNVDSPARGLVQCWAGGRAVSHWTLHALPYCECTDQTACFQMIFTE